VADRPEPFSSHMAVARSPAPAGMSAQACAPVCRRIHRGPAMETSRPWRCRNSDCRGGRGLGRRGTGSQRWSAVATLPGDIVRPPRSTVRPPRSLPLHRGPRHAAWSAHFDSPMEGTDQSPRRKFRQSRGRHTSCRLRPGGWPTTRRDDQHRRTSAEQRHLLRHLTREGTACRGHYPASCALRVPPRSESSLTAVDRGIPAVLAA
jgi:hypothetical protein